MTKTGVIEMKRCWS